MFSMKGSDYMKEKYIATGSWSTLSSELCYRVYEDVRVETINEYLNGQYTLDEVLGYLRESLLKQKEINYESFEVMISNMEDDEEDALMDLILYEDRTVDENGFIEVFTDYNNALEKHLELNYEYQEALIHTICNSVK